ncbi:hypothetical protein N9M66_02745 [Litoreibacter sp.]|nr:hypothetical protein [Litoreibacter sp.]
MQGVIAAVSTPIGADRTGDPQGSAVMPTFRALSNADGQSLTAELKG